MQLIRLQLLFFLFNISFSYKFLVYSPLYGHSHTTFLAKIADTLTAAGHDVTFLVPIVDEDGIGKKNVSLTKDVIEVDADPRVRDLMADMHKTTLRQMWEMTPDMLGLFQMAQNMTSSFGQTCENLLNNDQLLEKLKQKKYDVGIAEPFTVCGLGIFEHIGIPATIAALSTTQMDLVSWYIGEPIAPSYVPSMSSKFGEKMTLFERFKNAFDTVIGIRFIAGAMNAESEHIFNKIGTSKYGHFGDLLSKCSFVFTNANPYLNYPRPLLHKTIEVGGISIDAKNPGPLDEKFDKILNERKHTVFISFGSVARSKDMPEQWKKSILNMCASLPNVTFIWKYEVPTDMADHLPNVHLAPWLPQNALLADKRLTIFITHGGLGSTTEVAHLGKPAIMIPLFADQPRNAEMLSKHGGAIALHKTDLGDPDILRKAILTILNDESFAQAAKKLVNMLKEQPISPKELVVRHSEFVAKFGSLDNLEPYGRNLPIFQYYFIDIILLAIFVAFVLLLVLFSIVRWIFRRLFSLKKVKVQ